MSRPNATEVALVAATLGYGAALNRILPDRTHVPANLAAAGALLVAAHAAGASADELGLARLRGARGAGLGPGLALGVAGTVAVAASVRPARRFFADDRISALSPAAARYEAAVRIPIGTALAEELMFRGALLGVFRRRHSLAASVAASAAVFGVWHVLPTLQSLETHPERARVSRTRHRVGVLAGAVATTAAAGVAFSVLRVRSGSVFAPALVHAALNTAAFTATRVGARAL